MACSILAKERTPNRQIILISDGEPSAYIKWGRLYLEYPPSPLTTVETLKAVKTCTKAGIRINILCWGRIMLRRNFKATGPGLFHQS